MSTGTTQDKARQAVDLASVFDTIFCAVLVIGNDGTIVFCNEAAGTILDTTRDEIVGKTFREFYMLKDRLGKEVDLVHGVGRYQVDVTNGDIVCNLHPWFMDGKRQGSVLILHKSKENHCIAQELNVTSSLLTEMTVFLESSYDGFMVTDAQGVVIRINKALEKALSVSRLELIGRNVQDLVKEGFYSGSASVKVIKSKKPETITIIKNETTWMATGMPVFDNKGALSSVVVNLRDITALNSLNNRLKHQESVAEGYIIELMRVTKMTYEDTNLIAHSKAMQNILDIIKVISNVDSTVLITGESGTGKEVVVNEIYGRGHRRHRPIIKINCGAIPETLFESELFGYEEGAFTGAKKTGKAGAFELANQGTLFLDEVGELTADAQVKLLRVLQEGEITRVGGSRPIKVDVRVIAATNVDLWKRIEEGSFRADLFYRLNVVNIDLPPLRERREDIIPLAMYFLKKFNKKYHKDKTMDLALGQTLYQLDWLGNIRELENLIENMIVLTQSNVLLPEHMPPRYQKDETYNEPVAIKGIHPLKEVVAEAERQLLHNARRRYGTTREIARALKVDQSTVSRKLTQYFDV